MIDWKSIREEFPVCKEYVYLNAAGGSPISTSAANAAKKYYDEMLAYGDMPYEKWLVQTEETRSEVARYIGAETNEIAFTTNTSYGMNIVAQILRGTGTVLTMNDEFPSSTFPWLNQDVKIKMVQPENGFEYPIEKIEKELDDDVKILMTSYVQYCTGFKQDLEALGELCKKRDLIFVVNATQALPVFPVDVKKCNIDFLVFTGLKWATAGYGIGGLYMNKKWLESRNLPFAGWQSIDKPELMDNMNFIPSKRASVVESGCPHFAPIFALNGALALFNRIGKENVASRVINLNKYLHDQLKKYKIEIASPTAEKHLSGITIIRIQDAKEIVAKLKERNIIVSARGAGVRISVNIFNREEDIDKLMSALSEII